MQNGEGCEGCISEIIKNKTKNDLTIDAANRYTKEKGINTVVYFDGKEYAWCEESKLPDWAKYNVLNYFIP